MCLLFLYSFVLCLIHVNYNLKKRNHYCFHRVLPSAQVSLSFISSHTIHCPCVTFDNQSVFTLVQIKHYYQEESEIVLFPAFVHQ